MTPPQDVDRDAAGQRGRPCVVTYVYVHRPDERFFYPTSRASGFAEVASRYLECVLVQAASLRLRDVDCDVTLVTNVTEARQLDRRGQRLLSAIESLGVRTVFADYQHRPRAEVPMFLSSQYVFDAIAAVTRDADPGRELWFTDADCVWLDAERIFAARPDPSTIACIDIPYPLDWDIANFTPRDVIEIARRLGGGGGPTPWVGGELLGGTAADLRTLVSSCKELEIAAVERGFGLHTEEHLLSLAGAVGQASFCDLSPIARRIHTGPRHHAPPVPDPASLAFWHLPSEKGLTLRRAAGAVLAGHGARLARDLEAPARALKRFNIDGSVFRRVSDDLWIARRRLGEAARARLGGAAGAETVRGQRRD